MTVTVVSPPADLEGLAEFEALVSREAPTSGIREAFTGAPQALAQGSAVRVEPVPELLTTGRAAELLHVSRATVVKLLEDGRLPHERPNVHRLVRLEDVLAYRERRDAGRREFLRQLTSETVADRPSRVDPQEVRPLAYT
ncbi:MAG: helix-turn-helix domain-containing protein [Propionibacteriaceae bacterium]|nr:helix-turn-helix domain-containing protein [Propionibacteriaceae bacterium]